MIKFFRHFRKSILEQKKTASPAEASARAGMYFKYAIGEILLVVIGILIALQVNNWNEGLKLNKSEQTYLENLNEEMLQNDIELKLKIEQYKAIDQNLMVLADLMRPLPEPISQDRLDSLVIDMTFMPVYNPVKTFINSENLEEINNTTLKELIASWNFELDSYLYDTRFIYDLYYNAIYPFLEANYQLKTLHYNRSGKPASKFPIDQSKILSSPIFENQVTMKSVNHENAYQQLLVLAELQKKIIGIAGENIAPND